MRHAKLVWAFAIVLASFLTASAATTNNLVWNVASDQVSADIRGEALWPLLKDIAHQTGWHIFVEPGIDREADTKFQDLPRGEALKNLLGELNFAFVPQTNGPDFLYVFSTVMRNATQPVLAAAGLGKATPHGTHVPDELLVKVKPGTDIEALARALDAKIAGRDDKLGIYLLKFKDAAAADAARAQLQNNSDIATVDYNYLYDPPVTPQAVQGVPTSPISLTLNPPGNSGQVIVGLVDTAIQPLGDGLDKFILKQISVAGGANPGSTDPTHATSMAETILRAMAAQGSSTSAQILPVDVYGSEKLASTWNLALGIQQAVNAGANPINLSLGTSTDSPILDQVIQEAQAKGIVFFAAAGNQPVTTPTYPAALPGVNAVAATQGNDQFAPYSNYGSFISLGLPGQSVVYLGGSSFVVQGTSPATAYATGIAAGAKSNGSMTWQQILGAMQQKFPVPQK